LLPPNAIRIRARSANTGELLAILQRLSSYPNP
jgi:hypothetical protein